jgi:cytochrome c-type biogenesis protein CcsB
MKLLLRIAPWLAVALFGTEIIGVLLPRKDGEFHVHKFASLPVLLNGRVQPFDSVARNSLLQIRSTSAVPLEEVPSWKFWHHPKKLKATEWLLEVMCKPDMADTRPIFLIHHADILGELKLQDKGVEKSALRYYTFNELRPVLSEIGDQGGKAAKVKPEVQTTFQKQMAKLANAVMLYQRLKYTLEPPGITDFAQVLANFQRDLGPARVAAQAADKGGKTDEEALGRIAEPLRLFQTMADYGYPLIVPPLDAESSPDNWLNAGASLLETGHSGEVHPAVSQFVAMADAYRNDQPAAFNEALDQYTSWLEPKFTKELGKGRAEFYFNTVNAFLHAMIIYVAALLLALVAILTFAVSPALSESLRRSAFYLIIVAGLVHTFGLVFRMALEGRPPVTNLYSSAIFIGWGTMILGIILERIYRVGIGSLVASLAGFVTLMIAHNLALGGDTMEMLRAVLDTNFWLATHVVVVTLGYASTFFAGLLAIIYIFLGLFTPLLREKLGGATAKHTGAPAATRGRRSQPVVASAAKDPGQLELGRALSKMVYGIACFATLFSFVGTVLGGIWADQSWGRFWGWDPKENGALLIVLWNAIILHARWGGLVRERGLMNLAVFGNVVTSFSWFGVNMLGIGLHSYGFMDAAFKWLLMFVVLQLLIIGDGLLPRICWESLETANRGFGTVLRWIALGLNVFIMVLGFFAGYNSAVCIAALVVFFAFVLTASLAAPRVGATSPPKPRPATGGKGSPAPATT